MRGVKEGGVDIFGILDAAQFLHPAVWKGSRLRVFCQAKKGLVGEPIVRLFINDLHDLNNDKGRAFHLLPTDMRTLKGPVFGGLLSARGFTRGARDFAHARGFFLVDPKRITEVLLRSKRDIPGLMAGGSLRVDENLFEEYFGNDLDQS